MKKYIALIFGAVMLTSCTKTEFQKTTDTFKRADSMITRANDGVKTLDSISKILNDSGKINAEIRKQTRNVEKIIKENSGSIDSLRVVIRESGDRIGKSAETVKTLDSVQKVLRETDDPFEVLSTISKTIDKVTKDNNVVTSPQKQTPQETSPQSPPANQPPVQPQQNPQASVPPVAPQNPQVIIAEEPMVKTGLIEISVLDLTAAEAQLRNEIRNAEGRIISEKLGEQAGEKRQVMVAELPFQKFDAAANSVSRNIGSIRTKAIEQSGTLYDPNRISNLEIVLIQKIDESASAPAIITPPAENPTVEKSESSAETVGKIVLAALPFLPIVLIVGLAWYFINRRQKRKRAEEEQRFEQQKTYAEQSAQVQNPYNHPPTASSNKIPEYTTNPEPAQSDDPLSDDPYAKYKPRA